jgi:dTDP-4-dehydrorhamnose reductase
MGTILAEKMGLDKKFLKPVKMSEIKNWIAKRPHDSSLDTSKAARILKEKPLGMEQGLDYFIKQLRPMINK